MIGQRNQCRRRKKKCFTSIFFPFPTMFSKCFLFQICENLGLFGKGLNNLNMTTKLRYESFNKSLKNLKQKNKSVILNPYKNRNILNSTFNSAEVYLFMILPSAPQRALCKDALVQLKIIEISI